MNLLTNMSSTIMVIIGTMVGGMTLNPIALGAISGSGLLLKKFSEIKNSKKIEMSKLAYTTFKQVLMDLRSCLIQDTPVQPQVYTLYFPHFLLWWGICANVLIHWGSSI